MTCSKQAWIPRRQEVAVMAIKASQGGLATQADIDQLRTEWKTNISWLKWGVGITLVLVVTVQVVEILIAWRIILIVWRMWFSFY